MASVLNLTGGLANNNVGNGMTVAPTGSGAVYAYIGGNGVPLFTGNAIGILINGANSSGSIHATLSVNTTNNGIGIEVELGNFTAPVTVMVTQTSSVNNTGDGLFTTSSSDGTNVRVYVDRYQASGNAVGWASSGGSFIRSYGNNEVNGNTSDTTQPVISQE